MSNTRTRALVAGARHGIVRSASKISKKTWYWLTAMLSPVAIVLIWELITRVGLVRSILLPSPGEIAQSLWNVILNGYAGTSIAIHIAASLYRLLLAYALAVFFGVVFGLLRGGYRLVDAAMLVPAEVVRPVPPLAFIPLFILWFGIGEVSKILIIFYYVMLVIMLNTQAGVKSCPVDKTRAAQSLGASSRQIFLYIILPAALPQIMTGLRVGMAAALSILVASELLGGDRGLGFVIMDASTFFRTKEVFVGIILIGFLGFMSDLGLRYLSSKFVHWEGKK